MALTSGNQISKIFLKVLNVPIYLAADVGIGLGSWCIINVGRTAGLHVYSNNAICILGEFFRHHIRDVRSSSTSGALGNQAMHCHGVATQTATAILFTYSHSSSDVVFYWRNSHQ